MKIAWNVMRRKPLEETYNEIIEICLKLMRREIDIKDLVFLKGLGSHYKNKSYCMKIFSDELSRIGKPATAGERLEYLVVNSKGVEGKQLLGYKMRTPDTFLERVDTDEIEHIDYIYYLYNGIRNAIEKQLFQVGYIEELKALEEQYKKDDQVKVIEELKRMGYGIQMLQLTYKFEGDFEKVIKFLIEKTKLKNITKKLVSKHIRKYRRIVTRIHGKPIEMMSKLIKQKQECMNEIKTVRRSKNTSNSNNGKIKLNIITEEEYNKKYPTPEEWIEENTAKMKMIARNDIRIRDNRNINDIEDNRDNYNSNN